jgi:glutathione S-transferase
MSPALAQKTPQPIKLYGWQVSPYTAKVRSYLNYKNIPFTDNVPSFFTLNGKIKKDTGQMIMPVVYQGDSAIQDSTVIMESLESQYPQHSIYPDNDIQHFLALILEMFADEWLPLAALHYRWNFPGNRKFIYSEFGKSALPFFPSFIQNHIGKVFGNKMSGYLPVLGIATHMQEPLEKNTHEILNTLNEHLSHHSYIFWSQPSIADFALYGPIYSHLHRDPAPQNLLTPYKNIIKWINELNGDFKNTKHQWSNEENLVISLKPLLSIWAKSHAPLIRQSVNAMTHWVSQLTSEEKSQNTKLPKYLGKASIQLGDQQAERLNLTYGYWMFSRVHDFYHKLNTGSQHEIENLLTELKVMDLFQQTLPCKVNLHRCRLYLEPNCV